MPATVRIAANLTEKHVTEQVIGWLRANGWMCVRLQSGLMDLPGDRKIRIGTPGLPDWCCFKRDKYFFLELKRPNHDLSTQQVNWFGAAKRDRINCMWADGLGSFLSRFEQEAWSR